MKKFIALLLLCSLVFIGLTGCAGNESGTVDHNSPIELQSQDPLVKASIHYLHSYQIAFITDLPNTSVAIKMDQIKNGCQALHVGFDPSDSYFMVAYFNPIHNKESVEYCCAYEYTWVKFENAHDICETYKDKDFFAAIQINKALFVTDLLNKEAAVPKVEHTQIFTPEFQNGFNTKNALAFDGTCIYLNHSNDETIYFSMDGFEYDRTAFSCLFLNDRYFVSYVFYTTCPSCGRRTNADLHYQFNSYYNALMAQMENYTVTEEDGTAVTYGIIPVEDFANIIKE